MRNLYIHKKGRKWSPFPPPPRNNVVISVLKWTVCLSVHQSDCQEDFSSINEDTEFGMKEGWINGDHQRTLFRTLFISLFLVILPKENTNWLRKYLIAINKLRPIKSRRRRKKVEWNFIFSRFGLAWLGTITRTTPNDLSVFEPCLLSVSLLLCLSLFSVTFSMIKTFEWRHS